MYWQNPKERHLSWSLIKLITLFAVGGLFVASVKDGLNESKPTSQKLQTQEPPAGVLVLEEAPPGLNTEILEEIEVAPGSDNCQPVNAHDFEEDKTPDNPHEARRRIANKTGDHGPVNVFTWNKNAGKWEVLIPNAKALDLEGREVPDGSWVCRLRFVPDP